MDGSLGFFPSLIAGGVGTCTAELLSLPLDTVKVRLQLNAKVSCSNSAFLSNNYGSLKDSLCSLKRNNKKNVMSSAGNEIVDGLRNKVEPKMKLSIMSSNSNFMTVLKTMVREEGVLSPWKGLAAGLQRQLVYGSLRIGIYSDIRNFFCKNDEEKSNPPLNKKVLAGMTSGMLSMLVANPTDVVKVRLQGDRQNSNSNCRLYKGSVDAYKQIIKKEGILGLWVGLVPNIMRNCVINATELTAYDQIKQKALSYKLMKDDIILHVSAGFLAGFLAVCIGSPVDVTKTRLMNAKPHEYKNTFDVVKKIYANHGILGFYKGFMPNVFRIGLFNIVCFVVYEQVIHGFKNTKFFNH